MIEVRSSYLVKMADVHTATQLWRQLRDEIWPLLGWSGRVQQMLHGKAQQSTFVWSSEWENMASWEAGMARTNDCPEYKAFARMFNAVRIYGAEREVFQVLEPWQPMGAASGAVEVRSGYLVPTAKIGLAVELARRSQEAVWPVLGWSGQYQQMLHGKNSQSTFVWTSVWGSLAEWESAMAHTEGQEFQSWYAEWKACVDFGAEREVFRNL